MQSSFVSYLITSSSQGKDNVCMVLGDLSLFLKIDWFFSKEKSHKFSGKNFGIFFFLVES